MKSPKHIIAIITFLSGMLFAHIPQPENPSHLTEAQMKKISKIVGEHHKNGSSHKELHKAITALYKKWGIQFKKLKLKKQKSSD